MKQKILNLIYKIFSNLSKKYLSKKKVFVIGITGSVGKTSCRMTIYNILKQYFEVYTSPKNFNSEIGLPLSIFQIKSYSPNIFSILKNLFVILFKRIFCKPKYQILILEYGIDKPGDMDFLLEIVKPDISIITRIDFVHAGNGFENIDQLAKEKFKLAEKAVKKVYLNFKDEYIKQNYKKFSLSNVEFYANIDFEIFYYWKNGKIFSRINWNGKVLETNLLGTQDFDNIFLGINILENDLGKTFDLKFLEFENLPGRFSIFEGIKNSVIIDSSYNAAPESMKKMIENTILLQEKVFPDYKIIFVLGDMRELGKFSLSKHLELKNFITAFKQQKNISEIFTVGPNMKKVFGEKNNFKNSYELGKFLRDFLLNSDEKYLILVKGSQNTIFLEESVKNILKNPNDSKKLARQSKFWLKTKNNFFESK